MKYDLFQIVTMAGLLPEEACVVSIMHMVDPGTFWVAEVPDKDITEERRELSVLEESLQTLCRHNSFYNSSCYMPERGEVIFQLIYTVKPA